MGFIKASGLKKRFDQLPFKVSNYTQSNLQECRQSIKEDFAEITGKLPEIKVWIDSKFDKSKMHDSYRDILGGTHKATLPLFTIDEVAKFTRSRNIYRILFVFLVFFESILYSLMAPLILRRHILNHYPGIEYLFGFACAILFVAVLHFSLKKMWEFAEAKYLVDNNREYKKTKIKKFYFKLFLSIVVFILFNVANVGIGYLKIIVLEPGDISSNFYLDKIHGFRLIFLIATTFTVAWVMALLKKEITGKSVKYKVFLDWVKQQKERKKHNNQVRNMLKSCNEKKERDIEKYWGMLLDFQRVFNVQVDEDKKELFAELEQDILQKKVDLYNLDDYSYQKYSDIAGARFELFKYGVESDSAIKKIIADLKDVLDDLDSNDTTLKHLRPVTGMIKNFYRLSASQEFVRE